MIGSAAIRAMSRMNREAKEQEINAAKAEAVLKFARGGFMGIVAGRLVPVDLEQAAHDFINTQGWSMPEQAERGKP